MRCIICDQLLNEWESTRKDPETKEYSDTCTVCLRQSRNLDSDFSRSEEEEIINILIDNTKNI